jgi:hypothetical protein
MPTLEVISDLLDPMAVAFAQLLHVCETQPAQVC